MVDQVIRIVQNDAAIRRVRRMQPAGGSGDKIAPPTYLGERRGEGARHAFEHRREGEVQVLSVLLDSVASQANRLEEALSEALDRAGLHVPQLVVSFRGKDASLAFEGDGKSQKIVFGKGVAYDLSDIGTVSSLQAPHRVFDAIFRDSELEENGTAVPFRESQLFAQLKTTKPQNATMLFGLSPTALLFGSWNSTGSGGGLGAKFARSITSEIVGFGVAGRDDKGSVKPDGVRVGSRLDPLGIRKDAEVVGGAADWQVATANEKTRTKPSDINHSNIPPTISDGGVSVDYAKHTIVVSCAGLRRLRFPETSDESAGRVVLAALAIVAVLAQDRTGYAFRSRCDLVPEGSAAFEVVHPDGSVSPLEIDLAGALTLYTQAVEAARAAGFPWCEAPTTLQPQKKLVQLVALSRARGLAGEGEAEDS